ncbi:MAG: hypothetical protein J5857_08065 [Treponema sp.]|nr:hypothetical protein [Treponema sp.]
MEELRSTQALDNEIISDARKKSERILQRAEEMCASLLSDVDNRVQEALKQAQETQDTLLAAFKKNTEASLPLEKERYLVSFVNDSLLKAVNGYFEKAGVQKRLDVVASMVKRAIPVLDGRKVHAYVLALPLDSARKMLESSLGVQLMSVDNYTKTTIDEDALPGFDFEDGVMLITEDGSVKCRLTLKERVKEILDDKKMELSEALFAGGLSL